MTSGFFKWFERLFTSIGWRVVVEQVFAFLSKSYLCFLLSKFTFLVITFDQNVEDSQSRALKPRILA